MYHKHRENISNYYLVNYYLRVCSEIMEQNRTNDLSLEFSSNYDIC